MRGMAPRAAPTTATMSDDISHGLAGWPYDDQEGLQVRRIEGDDGLPAIQLRIDLGILQLRMTGRPDGLQPHGHESLLEHYRQQAEEYRRQHGWYEGFELDS